MSVCYLFLCHCLSPVLVFRDLLVVTNQFFFNIGID